MGPKRVISDEFDKIFNGKIILDKQIEHKLHIKHKVYSDDLSDALGDPYRVVMKPRQKSSEFKNKPRSSGKLFELLCETSTGRILFVVSRLFPDGNLYIITSYWANSKLEELYQQESEVLRDE